MISGIALVVANLVPILGVIFFDWQVGDVLLVYWAESAVIGVFNIAKMAYVDRWRVLAQGPFFAFHYGFFMYGHLRFIYGFLIEDPDDPTGFVISKVFAEFHLLFPALFALFVSHGVSFYVNFLGKREYEGRLIKDQMMEPYRRIIVMHMTIIFGGALTMAFESQLPALFLLIVLKVSVDLYAHHKEHKPLPEKANKPLAGKPL